MTPASMLTNMGGRRFVMVMGCGIVNTALVWFAKIDGAVYRDILAFTVGAYIAGNTWQKVKGPTDGTAG